MLLDGRMPVVGHDGDGGITLLRLCMGCVPHTARYRRVTRSGKSVARWRFAVVTAQTVRVPSVHPW